MDYVTSGLQAVGLVEAEDDDIDEIDEDTAELTMFVISLDRKKSVMLLFFGTICGFCGFLFAFIIGVAKFVYPSLSEYKGRNFTSGQGYFPATVSEMVHDPQDPAGKVFFAFEFIGAILIFMSWYPWYLSTAFTGDSETMLKWGYVSWSTFRQFIPAVGMMLVATVTTTPFAQATVLDYICIAWHLWGAVMLFGGYALAEAFCVFGSKVTSRMIVGPERSWRKFYLFGVAFWYALFCVLTVVCVLPLPGKGDVWEKHMVVDADGFLEPKIVLVDTAQGMILALKILSYVSEVLCGLCLLSSLMTIWYYSPERKIDLQDDILRKLQEQTSDDSAEDGGRWE